jgi:hypothetical protein
VTRLLEGTAEMPLTPFELGSIYLLE